VSLQPSATDILYRVGMLGRVVACTRHCAQVCAEAEGITTIVEDSWTAQAQQIIAAHPDLVIAAVPYQMEAVTEILKSGARFLGLAPRSLNDIYTDIAVIAGAVGASERGEQVVAKMRSDIETLGQRARPGDRPRVYCEEWGKPMIRSQPWVAELVAAAGGEFLGEPGTQTSVEQVAQENPDVIITDWCGVGDRVPLEKVVAERGWQNMKAVVERRIYCISDELLTTPSPILVEGLRALVAAIHPELHIEARGVRQITVVPRAPEHLA
jgi:iron complex transport system substrate-binding protein